MSSTKAHLEIQHLKVGFSGFDGYQEVLDVDHFVVGQGEAVGLVGESGSGKSVLGLAAMRLLRTPPARMQAERLRFGGADLLSLSSSEMRRLRGREMAMIFQDPMSALNPVFRVGSQLEDVIQHIYGERGKQARERACRYISLVDLPDAENTLSKYPHELSGGQRQRIIIALALCCEAKLIIADEPTRNLDVTVQAGILKTITRLRNELGVSLMFIANNLGLVSAMCDRVSVLLDGRIVESGTVDEVLDDPLHPYTRVLLKAIPTTQDHESGGSPTEITRPATTVAVEASESACAYITRCEARGDECTTCGRLGLEVAAGTHEVACVMSRRRGGNAGARTGAGGVSSLAQRESVVMQS